MGDSYSTRPRIWSGWSAAVADEWALPASARSSTSPVPGDGAERLFLDEMIGPVPSCLSGDAAPELYSLQWFLTLEQQRHQRRGRWIPRLLEFQRHVGETILCLGSGLGTDWVQYARHGSQVVACCASAEQMALVRRNFELRGLPARFVHAPPFHLPIDNACIDVVTVNGLLHEAEEPQRLVEEIYRVLRPGGKVIALVPAKYDIDFWFGVCFPLLRWLGYGRQPGQVLGLSGRRLHRQFALFADRHVSKRQLRRAEVPHVWRWAPVPLLERVMGRRLVFKGFKPVSTAGAARAAA